MASQYPSPSNAVVVPSRLMLTCFTTSSKSGNSYAHSNSFSKAISPTHLPRRCISLRLSWGGHGSAPGLLLPSISGVGRSSSLPFWQISGWHCQFATGAALVGVALYFNIAVGRFDNFFPPPRLVCLTLSTTMGRPSVSNPFRERAVASFPTSATALAICSSCSSILPSGSMLVVMLMLPSASFCSVLLRLLFLHQIYIKLEPHPSITHTYQHRAIIFHKTVQVQ